MIAPSTKCAPVGAMMAATCLTVCVLMALQSTKIGLRGLRVSAGTRRSARASASAGGTIEKTISARAIRSSSTAIMPESSARRRVEELRPSNKVRTRPPFSVSRCATALPMAPAAMIANSRVMMVLLKLQKVGGNLDPFGRASSRPSRRMRRKHTGRQPAEPARGRQRRPIALLGDPRTGAGRAEPGGNGPNRFHRVHVYLSQAPGEDPAKWLTDASADLAAQDVVQKLKLHLPETYSNEHPAPPAEGARPKRPCKACARSWAS